MKVAIIAPFYEYDEAYSLCGVVKNQLEMLLRNDIDVTLLVNKGFKAGGVFAQVELVEMPHVINENEFNGPAMPMEFDNCVNIMYEALKEALKDIDICLTHDLILQNAYLVHHVAARRIAAESKIWWLNWVHSASKPMHSGLAATERLSLGTPFNNSFVVYPNDGDIKRVAVNYGVSEDQVKVIPHPIDIYDYFGFDAAAIDLCERFRLLDSDILSIYPVRLDRGKQPHLIIEIFAALNAMGQNAKLLIVDFHSSGGDKVKYRSEMMAQINRLGLTGKVHFASSVYGGDSITNNAIANLFSISNVFFLTSTSETYSLIAQEAAIAGNLLVLNYDFPPLRSIYGYAPYYFPFSSSINALTGEDGETTTKITNRDGFFQIIARNVIHELSTNRALSLRTHLRKTRNIQAVYDKYLGPLLHNCVYRLETKREAIPEQLPDLSFSCLVMRHG